MHEKKEFTIEEVWDTYHTMDRIITPRLIACKNLDKHSYTPDHDNMEKWNCTI